MIIYSFDVREATIVYIKLIVASDDEESLRNTNTDVKVTIYTGLMQEMLRGFGWNKLI